MAATKKFQKILIDFNEDQLKFKEKCRQKITSFLSISGRQLPDDDIDNAIESGQLFDYTKGLILAQRDKKALYDEVKMRHDDILKLEFSIRDLNDLFLDISGEMLNHIESNVESALDYANKAHGKVKEVRKIREGLRKKKIILFIIIIILIVILFIIGSTVFCFYLPFFCKRK
ncbi:unnamed protein product [Dracunculus medinensis]|uniref:t-SNARE coiled-coil homology domain-containing protein n=1 Tax=Dracunculus medinensis TaxID=318479 RepID=A0A0N4UPN4_DRAME|nr:unnamed protein product [Dracunculus medinensis]